MFKKFLIFIFTSLIVLFGINHLSDINNILENNYNTVSLNNIEKNNNEIINNIEKNNSIIINNIENNVSNHVTQDKIVEENIEEIFSQYYKKAEKLMKNMTIEEKVGQMFLARYPKNGVIEEIKTHKPGGYVTSCTCWK